MGFVKPREKIEVPLVATQPFLQLALRTLNRLLGSICPLTDISLGAEHVKHIKLEKELSYIIAFNQNE